MDLTTYDPRRGPDSDGKRRRMRLHSPRRDRALADLQSSIGQCVKAGLVEEERAAALRARLQMDWPQGPQNIEWVDVWRDLVAAILYRRGREAGR